MAARSLSASASFSRPGHATREASSYAGEAVATVGSDVIPSPMNKAEQAHTQLERAGRVIENPISGERIIIRVTGAETNGRLLVFDLFLPPGGHVPAGHAHPAQEERFTVLSGLMRFRLGRRAIVAHPGETIVVPAGTAHWFGNPGASVAHARVEVRPALRMQEFFEMTEALSATGRLLSARLPRPAALARLLLEFQREVAVPHVPAFLVRAVLTPLAWLGRRRAETPTPESADSGSTG
jgi:quercetin dioxygenase-like cupin family protein